MSVPLRGLLLLSCLCFGGPSVAQTVDYANAEAMFGEPVTVSVTGKPQRASEAPANITILTADDIWRSGATDIPSVLRFVPGLDVRRYGQLQASVGIRGYNTAFNPRVLVLVDGRQVYNDDYGYTIWSLIPVTMAEIRQIEIIRGPNAALYGFNAVSGVINIVTFDPLRDRRTSVTARGGTNDSIVGEGVVTLQHEDRAGLRVSAKGRRAREFAGERRPGSVGEPGVHTGSADLRIRLTDDVQLDVAATSGRLEADQYIDTGAYIGTRLENGSLRTTLTANTPVGLAHFDAYHNTTAQRLDVPIFTASWDQAVTVLKASNLVRLRRDHTVRFAAEYRHNAVSSERFFGGRMTSDLVAGSVGWNWQIHRTLSLTNALRFDRVALARNESEIFLPGLGHPFGDRRYNEPSYNSSLLYTPTDFDTVRLGTARALQLPSLFSYGFRARVGALNVLGSRFLEPSAVTNYEIGYERKLPALGSVFSLALFHQDTDRTIGTPFGSGLVMSPAGAPYLTARNLDGSRATGGEIGLEGESESGWRWRIAYSLARLRDETPASILFDAASVAYEAQTPAHAVTGGIGFTWRGFEVDAAAKWQSRFTDFRSTVAAGRFDEFEVADYLIVNGRAAYRLDERSTLSVTAEQINARRQTQTAGREFERRVLAGLSVEF